MYHLILLLILMAQPVTSLVATDDEVYLKITKPEIKTMRDRVRNLNEKSITTVNRFWNSNTMYEYLCKGFTGQLQQLPQDLQRTSFEIISSTEHATSSIVREDTTWQDLAMFAGKRPDDRYVGQILTRTKTEIGRAQLLGLLAASSNDHAEILRRQAIVKALLANQELQGQLNTLFKSYAESENVLFTFWQQDHFLNSIAEYKFTDPICKNFNDSSFAILSKYAFDGFERSNQLLSGADNLKSLILFLLAMAIDPSSPSARTFEADAKSVHHSNFLKKSLWEHGPAAIKLLLAAWSCYSLYNSFDRTIEHQVDAWMFEEILHHKLTHIAAVCTVLQQTMLLVEQEQTLLTLLPELEALKKLFATTNEQNAPLRTFLDLIQDDTFAKDADGFFANRGKIFTAYTEFHKLKDSLFPPLQALSLLDAYSSVATLLQQEPTKYCFAELVYADSPHLYLEEFINPLVVVHDEKGPKTVTANTIKLSSNGPSRNCVITGPNAGGKSTLIKAIGINVLMAQSLGIAAAKKCVLTPFSYMATYLNITDDINTGNSLFKAEVLRTQELIKAIDSLERGQYGLLIFDEIFNGTTPTEGSAAAYAVAEHLGKYANGITILATHFEQLTKLANVPKCNYNNYKVSVTINKDGTLLYPFKLLPGISQQHIALDILRSEGYSGTIITRTADLLGR